MRRMRRILLALAGIAVVMLTIHLIVNGFPALSSLNPHGH
jgi:hypothetical protein